MKALLVKDYGPPENARIGDVERPKPKDGFLLVRIKAAAVNPYDVKLIAGMFKDYQPLTFPFVPGIDGAGIVEETGAGVDGFNQGDAVFGMFKSGTLAQFAVVSATDKRLARKPAGIDFIQAAAIPQSGLTAKTTLRAAALEKGQSVFVFGATGGVGLYVTQLAKAGGATVVATGTASDAEYLRGLGVDGVIDYKAGDAFDQAKQRYPNGFDAVVDLVNSGDALLHDAEIVRPGGKVLSTLSGPEQTAFPAGVEIHYIHLKAQAGDLDDLADRAARGHLRVEVGRAYPFDEAAQALADLGDRSKHVRGKLVVTGAEIAAP